MAQIIDFESRKKLIESKKNAPGKKAEISATNFALLSERNKVAQDKAKKDREQANNKVMKSYRIK